MGTDPLARVVLHEGRPPVRRELVGSLEAPVPELVRESSAGGVVLSDSIAGEYAANPGIHRATASGPRAVSHPCLGLSLGYPRELADEQPSAVLLGNGQHHVGIGSRGTDDLQPIGLFTLSSAAGEKQEEEGALHAFRIPPTILHRKSHGVSP